MSWLDRLRSRRGHRREAFAVSFEPKTARPGDTLHVTLTPTDAGATSGPLEVVLVCRTRADGSPVRRVAVEVPGAAAGATRTVDVAVPADAPTTEEGGQGVRDWQVVVRAVGGRKVAKPEPLWVAGRAD